MSYGINPLVAAGIFGVTNMGMAMPEEGDVQRAIQLVNDPKWGKTADAGTMVEYFAQQYIESDEHFDIFEEEIESWHQRFKSEGTDQIQNMWPDHWALYQRAMNTMD